MVIVTARGRATHLPGVAVLAGYRRDWLRGDLLAGVAVAAYLVPQVMAYAGIAGLPPAAGLWACLGSLASTRCSGRRASCRSARSRRPR